MYKFGHIGVALLVYSPVGFGMLVAGIEDLAVIGGAAMVALANLPDCDHNLPFVQHRGFTHTVGFALTVGLAVAAAGYLFGEYLLAWPATTLASFGLLVGTLSILSHIAADSITPMGIRPFWPLSRWHYTANVVRAKSPVANYLLLAAGIFAATMALLLAARM